MGVSLGVASVLLVLVLFNKPATPQARRSGGRAHRPVPFSVFTSREGGSSYKLGTYPEPAFDGLPRQVL